MVITGAVSGVILLSYAGFLVWTTRRTHKKEGKIASDIRKCLHTFLVENVEWEWKDGYYVWSSGEVRVLMHVDGYQEWKIYHGDRLIIGTYENASDLFEHVYQQRDIFVAQYQAYWMYLFETKKMYNEAEKVRNDANERKKEQQPTPSIHAMFFEESARNTRRDAEKVNDAYSIWSNNMDLFQKTAKELLQDSSYLTEEDIHRLQVTYPNDLAHLKAMYDALKTENQKEVIHMLKQAFDDLFAELEKMSQHIEERKTKAFTTQIRLIQSRRGNE